MSALLRPLLFLGLLAGALFGCAGRWDLPFFWAYMGVCACLMLAAVLVMPKDLRQERASLDNPCRNLLLRLVLLPFVLSHLILAGLDVGRFDWSNTVAWEIQVACMLGFALAAGLVSWAVAVNRFFAPAVRIQTERNHHVITVGPYQYIRHPAYAGLMIAFLCSGPALGSWWAMLPIAGYAAVLFCRTSHEDRFLLRELPGYGEYAQKVRFRLLPGIW